MLLLNRLSIQWKLTLLAGLCLLLIVGLLVGASLYQSRQTVALVNASSSTMLEESARNNLQARGLAQALRIERQFNDAYQYGLGLTRQVLSLREQSIERMSNAFELREDLRHQLEMALQANPDLIGLYAVFEPDALDDKDGMFIGNAEMGGNDSGRFSLYWSQRTPGQLNAENHERGLARRYDARDQRRALQRLVCLPPRSRPGLFARSLFRRGGRPATADDQHRLSADRSR